MMQLLSARALVVVALLLLMMMTLSTTRRNCLVASFSLKPSVSPYQYSLSSSKTNTNTNTDNVSTSRRDWIKSITTSTIAATTGSLFTFGIITTPLPSWAVSTSTKSSSSSSSSFQTYKDEKYGFTIDIPSNWNPMNDVTALSDRRSIVVYTDPNESSTSILIVYTPIRDDYTSLSSFGSVDQVAAQTILPKGNLFNEENTIVAKMISATSAQQSYMFDYIQQVPEVQQPLTHYRTIFTLGSSTKNSSTSTNTNNSAGAMLITITLQTPESRYTGTNNSEQVIFDQIINSYTRV